MPRRVRKSRKSASSGSLNVTGPGQFGQLSKLLGKNPVVLVFVYADWCGHCQHFKPDWKKLESTPNRNMAMVSVRDDALKNSPLNNLVTPEGYPTVAVVSKANDVAVNLPTRDPSVLKNIITNADSLVPANAEALNANLENIIQENMPVTGFNKNQLSAEVPSSVTEMNQVRLSPAENDSEIEVKKTTHSAIVPVTHDSIEPPLAEVDYLKNEETTAPINMKQLGGGLWSMFTSSGASPSAAPLNVLVKSGGSRKMGSKQRRRKTQRRR